MCTSFLLVIFQKSATAFPHWFWFWLSVFQIWTPLSCLLQWGPWPLCMQKCSPFLNHNYTIKPQLEIINAVSSFSQNNPCKQILIWCIVCCDKNGCGVLLLLLLKFLFCVDFLLLRIWFVFIAMHLRWNTLLFRLPCFLLSSFQV